MTVNDVMTAVAVKLGELFPDRLVYDKAIEQAADGQHYVRCIEQTHGKLLDRRRSRSYSFEVLYFRKDNDPEEFNAWAETMYMEFETLTLADGQILRVTGASATDGDDMVFHFTFDVTFTVLLDPGAGDPMERLDISTFEKSEAVLGTFIVDVSRLA